MSCRGNQSGPRWIEASAILREINLCGNLIGEPAARELLTALEARKEGRKDLSLAVYSSYSYLSGFFLCLSFAFSHLPYGYALH